MFKKIPGNHDYILSLNSEIRKLNGSVCDLPIANNQITINLYGQVETVDLFWLSLITHFEVRLPQDYKAISFVDCNPVFTKSNSGKVMVFAEPVVVKGEYRVVPNYTDYAVSIDGKVLEVERGAEMTNIVLVNDYPAISIYDPDRGFFKKIFIHRMVAMAWKDNRDYFAHPMVNHMDGDKYNCHASNLEWCSFKENIQHAYRTGLHHGGKKYKVRDIKTSVVTTYDSFKHVCLAIGLHENTRFKDKANRKRTTVVRDRYEIKELEDNSPWMSDEDALIRKSKYTITLTHPDNSIEILYTIPELMKRLRIWNISYNVNKIVEVAKVKYPDMRIDVVDNFAGGEVQALNTASGIVTEANSVRELSRKLNLGFSTIHKAVNNPEKYECKGYVFRYKTNEPWETSYKRHPNAPKHIRAKNVVTGEEIDFPTMKDVCATFKASNFVVRNKMENHLQLGDWVFEEVLTL